MVVRERPMLRTCERPGCQTLTLGVHCVAHEPATVQSEFVRGRPHQRVNDELSAQLLRLPKKISA
jgi:hypothetical protein